MPDSGGDHSAARSLAAQAGALRSAALAEHAAAATRIEATNNASKCLGPLRLDLHGLHAWEAVAALDRRYGPEQQSRVAARSPSFVGTVPIVWPAQSRLPATAIGYWLGTVL